MKLLLVVACALIDADNRVLVTQRPEGKQLAGLWEFPGGKLEAGERPEPALIRELAEELGITVKEDCLAPLTFASCVGLPCTGTRRLCSSPSPMAAWRAAFSSIAMPP